MNPKICVVVSEFNKDVTAEIQNSAVHKLNDKGITGKEYLKVIYVKGAFEIPYVISKLIDKYEKVNRNFYGGAIGYIDFKGNFEILL